MILFDTPVQVRVFLKEYAEIQELGIPTMWKQAYRRQKIRIEFAVSFRTAKEKRYW